MRSSGSCLSWSPPWTHWNVEVYYVNIFNTAATTHTFLVTVGALAY